MWPTEIQGRVFHPAMHIAFLLVRKLMLALGLGLTFTPVQMFTDIMGNFKILISAQRIYILCAD